MTEAKTQANLVLFIGETYCELEVRTLDNTNIEDNIHGKKSLLVKDFFLPQTTLKNILGQINKQLAGQNIEIQSIYTVYKYFDRLKNFRLGGSVIQVTHAGLENNYVFENTMKQSLAASSLIISIPTPFNLDQFINDFERVKKINPEANKAVINLDPCVINSETFHFIENFFKAKNFSIFKTETSKNIVSLRKVLLSAGTQGTRDELISEIKEAFPSSSIFIWIKNQFRKYDDVENYDLYFSAQDFLAHRFLKNSTEKIVHLDIESWEIIDNTQEQFWDSPWGKIERQHFAVKKMALHPLTEILIDENGLLQFSKTPIASEPGPMTAGRGVKSVALDTFFEEIKRSEQLNDLFRHSFQTTTENKIKAQFKVLEHGQTLLQSSSVKTLQQSDIKNYILDLILFDIQKSGCSKINTFYSGNLSFLVKNKNKFRWTREIFEEIP